MLLLILYTNVFALVAFISFVSKLMVSANATVCGKLALAS